MRGTMIFPEARPSIILYTPREQLWRGRGYAATSERRWLSRACKGRHRAHDPQRALGVYGMSARGSAVGLCGRVGSSCVGFAEGLCVSSTRHIARCVIGFITRVRSSSPPVDNELKTKRKEKAHDESIVFLPSAKKKYVYFLWVTCVCPYIIVQPQSSGGMRAPLFLSIVAGSESMREEIREER